MGFFHAYCCRFEFYEGIVRASFGKFIASGIMSDASDATHAFLTEVRG